jgi:hypothetical protein
MNGDEGVVPASYVEVRSPAYLISLSLLEPEGTSSPQVQAVGLPGPRNQKKMARPSASQRRCGSGASRTRGERERGPRMQGEEGSGAACQSATAEAEHKAQEK